jgi:hypothetical protein
MAALLFFYFKEDKVMSDLKGKLAQRIEKVQEKDAQAVQTSEVTEIETVAVDNDKITKLIPVKANDVVPEFAITISEARQRTKMLQKFVKDMMIADVDYGIIKGCVKPSLLKPGAEKLCEIFGFSKQVEILNRIEDWDKGLFHYEVKVILTNKRSGVIEAEGIGCCNSREKKFKNQDSFSIVNTLLKMAKKRALVDAVLSATRSSGLFTQDIEEMNFNDEPQTPKSSVKPVPTITKQSPKPLSKEQQKEIFAVIRQGRIPLDYAQGIMIEKYNIEETARLTAEQADEYIDILKCSQAV